MRIAQGLVLLAGGRRAPPARAALLRARLLELIAAADLEFGDPEEDGWALVAPHRHPAHAARTARTGPGARRPETRLRRPAGSARQPLAKRSVRRRLPRTRRPLGSVS